MIISCDECDTKFMIKAESFGAKPRKVRCGNCSHVWSQEPPADEAVKAENKIIKDQEENLAAAVKAQAAGVKPALPTIVAKPVPKWMKAAVVTLALLNVFGFVIFNKQIVGQTGFYNMLGNYDTRFITIDGSQLTPVPGDEKNVYLSWSVHNGGKSSAQIPQIRVRIYDKDLRLLHKGTDKPTEMISADKNYDFKQRKMSADGKYLVLDIGNPYDLMWR